MGGAHTSHVQVILHKLILLLTEDIHNNLKLVMYNFPTNNLSLLLVQFAGSHSNLSHRCFPLYLPLYQ